MSADDGIVNIHGKHHTAPNGCEYLVTSGGEIYRKVKSRKNSQSAYRQTSLGRGNVVYVHQLVCEMFHGPKPSPSHMVRHLDGDRQNNSADNLCWGTHRENMGDAVEHGTMGGRVLTANDIAVIRSHPATYGSRKFLAKNFGVTENYITDIRAGRARQ